MLAVGKPSVRPSFWPSDHFALNGETIAQQPACLHGTRLRPAASGCGSTRRCSAPSSRNASTSDTSKPCACRSPSEGRSTLPVLAEMKIETGDDMADAEPPSSTCGHEGFGRLVANSRVNACSTSRQSPAADSSFAFIAGGVRTKSGSSGRNTLRGCGSKVSTRRERPAFQPPPAHAPSTA